ncbi:MAG: response regulator [Pirellulales bacterium]
MTSTHHRILIIEDEPPIAKFLRATLSTAEYETIEASNGRQGIQKAAEQPPDLIILDLGLPDMDGKLVLTELREWFNGPIIILSARDQESEKVAALDLGADDYLTKPFGVGELQARLRAAFRHANSGMSESNLLNYGELVIDLSSRVARLANEELHLTPLEYKLMVMLMKNAGKVLTHRQLLREIWGPDCSYENHYLRVFVANLRKKIGDDSANPRFILTEPGIGYRFKGE